jgi:hypothetical protein
MIEVVIHVIEQSRWFDLGFYIKGDAELLLIADQNIEMRALTLPLSIIFGLSFQHAVITYGHKSHQPDANGFSFLFQSAILAAMMPYRFGLYLNGILAVVATLCHPPDEFMNLLLGHSGRLNSSHLTAYHTVVALRLVNGHDSILWMVLAVSVTQVEAISIVKTITYRPLMVDHSLYQIVFALQLLEGKHALGMNHDLHQPEYL